MKDAWVSLAHYVAQHEAGAEGAGNEAARSLRRGAVGPISTCEGAGPRLRNIELKQARVLVPITALSRSRARA